MDKIFIGEVSFCQKIRTIEQNGREIKLRNKESEMLKLLCENYPEPVSRRKIEQSIWAGSYVTENTLTQTISNLRNAIDDKKHELILTIPKKGYCLAVEPKMNNFDSRKISEEPTSIVKKSTEKVNINELSFFTWLIGVGIFLFVFYFTSLFFLIAIKLIFFLCNRKVYLF